MRANAGCRPIPSSHVTICRIAATSLTAQHALPVYQRPHQCPAKTGPDVPERGSLALLGLEIVGLAASRRKRPKAA
jgi:hypothetical protein